MVVYYVSKWYLALSTQHLALKRDRQDQKLAIASAKKQGKTVATDGTISGSVDSSKPYYRENNTLDITQLQ